MTNPPPAHPEGSFLANLMRLPTHECDDVCRDGEEQTQRTFTREDGHIIVVHGPRTTIDAMTAPPDLHPQDRRIRHHTVHLPTRVGATARAAILADAERDYPEYAVTVDCWGGVMLLPGSLDFLKQAGCEQWGDNVTACRMPDGV